MVVSRKEKFYSLQCSQCGMPQDHSKGVSLCVDCKAPPDLFYSKPASLDFSQFRNGRLANYFPGLWSMWDVLPLHDPSNIVSLGEGGTPCVPLKNIGNKLGLKDLWAKLEYLNPTGSFKDRGTTVMLSAAKEFGLTRLVEDSSGNAGSSFASYASRGQLDASVFIPEHAPHAKRLQISFYGADVYPTAGTRDDVAQSAVDYAVENGLYYSSHNISPYFIEGTKTVAYELMLWSGNRTIDHMIFPVGNGSLIIGCWKGFKEVKESRNYDDAQPVTFPKLHAVQSHACNPIVSHWRGTQWDVSQVSNGIAGGIMVGTPPRGFQVLQVLEDTSGSAVSVSDGDIGTWQKLLAEEEGLFVEPTSAAAFAGLELLVADRTISKGDLTVVPITGFGLKDTKNLDVG